jgi:hypothetical protein
LGFLEFGFAFIGAGVLVDIAIQTNGNRFDGFIHAAYLHEIFSMGFIY